MVREGKRLYDREYMLGLYAKGESLYFTDAQWANFYDVLADEYAEER